MGGYNPSARPQSTTGELKYAPLSKFEVPSSQPELVAKGIESAASNISSGVLSGMKAKYAQDNFKTPKTDDIEITPQKEIDYYQPIPETETAQNMGDQKPSWFSQMFNLFKFHKNTQPYNQ